MSSSVALRGERMISMVSHCTAEFQLWPVKVVDLQVAQVQMEQLVSGHSSSVIRAQKQGHQSHAAQERSAQLQEPAACYINSAGQSEYK